MSTKRMVEVVADWIGIESPTLMGHLSATPNSWQRSVSETDNAQDIDLALSVAAVFRVKTERAQEIVNDVTAAVHPWRSLAASHGLSRSAQDRMRRAFRVAEAWINR